MTSPKRKYKPLPKAKQLVQIPPVPTKKWVPPEERPKKKPPPPAFIPPQPPGKSLRIPGSTLNKNWGHFVFSEGMTQMGVVLGPFSMNNPRYKHIKGKQEIAACLVAACSHKIKTMKEWTQDFVNLILDSGTQLQRASAEKHQCKSCLTFEDINTFFYMGDNKIIFAIDKASKLTSKTSKCEAKKILTQTLTEYFKRNSACLFELNGSYLALWRAKDDPKDPKTRSTFYLYDPRCHNNKGKRTVTAPPGFGYSLVGKFFIFNNFVETIFSMFPPFSQANFTILPVKVMKVGELNLQPPETFEDLEVAKADVGKCTKGHEKTTFVEGDQQQIDKEALEKQKMDEDINPLEAQKYLGAGDVMPSLKTLRKEDQKFLNKPNMPLPTSRYKELVPKTIGILRARACQEDKKFSKYVGRESLGQAISCLTTLRIAKSKMWLSRTVNDILEYGELIYNEAMKNKPYGYSLKLSDFPKMIKMTNKSYELETDEHAAFGKLNSLDPEILDLLPCLETFLTDHNCAIIVGPIIVPVWFQDNLFYMFDPNCRDSTGRRNFKAPVSKDDENDYYACVMWFRRLQDLVALYMYNVGEKNNTEYFTLGKVKINDDPKIPTPWFNFQPIATNRWILRADFNQNDKRFQHPGRGLQCTAMATMALIFANMLPNFREWSKETLTQVLQNGDKLYQESIAKQKQKNPNFAEMMLVADEVARQFTVDKFMCNIKAIPTFFESNNFGLITAGYISICMWKGGNNEYYYFDSHSRNEKGLSGSMGRAMVVRASNVKELSKSVLPNIPCQSDNEYNLYKLDIQLYDASSGIAKPPAINYKTVNEDILILRSFYNEEHDKFEVNAGKQTIANCIMALLYNKLQDANLWKTKDMDEILIKGDEHYGLSVQKKEENEEEEDADDKITSENILKNAKIGINNLSFEFEEIESGPIKSTLKSALKTQFEPKSTEEDLNREALLETKSYSVSIFRDPFAYYVFDPKPRCKKGQVIGKVSWKAYQDGAGDQGDEGEEDEDDDDAKDKGEDGDADAEDEEEEDEDEDAGFKAISTQKDKKSSGTRTPEYWAEMTKQYGHACCIKFLRLEDMIQHVFKNIHPSNKNGTFSLKSVKIENDPEYKDKFRPEEGEKPKSKFDGNWYNFQEVVRGKWIISGTFRLDDETFPAINRGKQILPSCLSFLLFFEILSPKNMSKNALDQIMLYGDRIYTKSIQTKQNNLKNTSLEDDYIKQLLSEAFFMIEDIPKTVKITKHILDISVTENNLMGDIGAADDIDYIDNLPKGLDRFFQENGYGILQCKDLTVGIAKGAQVFYMFDPLNRGPSGSYDPVGNPCVTRYRQVKELSRVFLSNIRDPYGENTFTIHQVALVDTIKPPTREELAEEREEAKKKQLEALKTKPVESSDRLTSKTAVPTLRQPKPVEPSSKLPSRTTVPTLQQPKPTESSNKITSRTAVPTLKHPKPVEIDKTEPPRLGGFLKIASGTKILRGGEVLDEIEKNSVATVFVALAMTLIHNCSTWTRPIIDEINKNGLMAYQESMNILGFDFNPWEDKMAITQVTNDFQIGVLKAHCVLVVPGISGILNTKNPQQTNLKAALKEFFESNSHGILETNGLSFAIWEAIDDLANERHIYIFDPYSRSSTGHILPFGGRPCVLNFTNHNMAADHIVNLFYDPKKQAAEFVLTPVEIMVGSKKSRVRKPPKEGEKCSKLYASEKERELRKLAEEELQKKELHRINLLGRAQFFELSKGEAILRGYRSQKSEIYPEAARGNQDICFCVVAILYKKLIPVHKWDSRVIDLVMDTGNQYYIDSKITYRPEHKQLGLQNLLRTLTVKDVTFKISYYNPMNKEPLSLSKEVLFTFVSGFMLRQKDICMIQYIPDIKKQGNDDWFSIMSSEGSYYLFDPHNRNLSGKPDKNGTAVVYRFDDLEKLAVRLVDNCREPITDGAEQEEPGVWNLYYFKMAITPQMPPIIPPCGQPIVQKESDMPFNTLASTKRII